MTHLLEVSGVWKSFDEHPVLRGIDLHVEQHQASTQRAGQADRFGQAAAGGGTAVERHEDALVHEMGFRGSVPFSVPACQIG